MPIYNKLFADRLQRAMKLRKMKQSDLSALTGLYRGTISNYVTGKYIPKEDKMDLIARALNVNKAYLYGVSDIVDRLEDEEYAAISDWLAKGVSDINASSAAEDDVEKLIIKNYRAADDKTKKAVRIMLGVEE